MLKNGYLLAKIGADTAENEPLKVHLIIKPLDLIFTEPRRPGRDRRRNDAPAGYRSIRAERTRPGVLPPAIGAVAQ